MVRGTAWPALGLQACQPEASCWQRQTERSGHRGGHTRPWPKGQGCVWVREADAPWLSGLRSAQTRFRMHRGHCWHPARHRQRRRPFPPAPRGGCWESPGGPRRRTRVKGWEGSDLGRSAASPSQVLPAVRRRPELYFLGVDRRQPATARVAGCHRPGTASHVPVGIAGSLAWRA